MKHYLDVLIASEGTGDSGAVRQGSVRDSGVGRVEALPQGIGGITVVAERQCMFPDTAAAPRVKLSADKGRERSPDNGSFSSSISSDVDLRRNQGSVGESFDVVGGTIVGVDRAEHLQVESSEPSAILGTRSSVKKTHLPSVVVLYFSERSDGSVRRRVGSRSLRNGPQSASCPTLAVLNFRLARSRVLTW